MRTVKDAEARGVYDWLVEKGVKFAFGKDAATELTLEQVLEQCKMYIAAVRIAKDYGCDAIGIQYQQGLKDMVAASDLAEGMLNNAERPPVFAEADEEELYAGGPVVHFNEVDECAGTDAMITNRCWKALGLDPSTTLHDVRWGEHYKGEGPADWMRLCGCCRFPARRRRITLWMAMRARRANGSRRCIFRWAAAR